MSALRAVLFDWDGTLVDSAETSFRCYVKLFERYGIAFGRDEFERTYSPDWHRTYTALSLPREKWPEADALWVEHYGREPSRLLPGVREALARLSEAGLAQGIVSSGDGGRVRRELETHGLSALFSAVVCSGDTARRKPDPEPLLLALSRLQVRPEEAAYVGDSPEDVLMARAAGVFVVGIPGGFPNGDALRAAAPDVMAEGLEQATRELLARIPDQASSNSR